MLKKQGKQIYQDLSEYMRNHSRLEKVDEFTIIQLATYSQVWFEMQQEVLKPGGSIQVYKNGSSNISGHMVAMNKAMDFIITISQKVGIYEIIKDKLHQYGKITKETKDYFN